MTLLKVKDGDGLWEQVENVGDYAKSTLPFREIPLGPRPALTFVSPGALQDYFVPNSEVPVSQYPLIGDEPASWPERRGRRRRRRDSSTGSRRRWPKTSGPQVADDAEFVDPDALDVEIDDVKYTKDNKLKELQSACQKLGLPTSGSKMRVLRRLQQYKYKQEERVAFEVAQRLYSEARREAVPVPTPKLPSRHEQEMRQLTHIPYQAWCQTCIATRAKEDARTEADRNEVKDRGRSIISFDFGYTYTRGIEEEKQLGTALYVAEPETKAVVCIPVAAKGSVSLKQVTEEITRFSMQVGGGQPMIFQADGERSTRQILRAIQHARASLGLSSEIRTTSRDQHQSN